MKNGRMLNICFHGIGTPRRSLSPGESRYWITSDEFHRILDEVASWPHVRISFDDGNLSDVEIGLDALVQRGLTATFFVLAGRLLVPGSLNESDIHELLRNHMTIGTHGMDHRPWRGMAHDVRNRELVEARCRIADVVGAPIDEAALPLGRYDRKLLADLRRLGYAAVHTSDRRAAHLGSWLQPRFSVRSDDTPQTMRESVLKPPPWPLRMKLEAKGVAKRLR
jgi:peptidoglycan/xylan/chitin deacetylase (PgdA/CDA1 family)